LKKKVADFHKNFIKIALTCQCKHYIKLVSKNDQNHYQSAAIEQKYDKQPLGTHSENVR